MRISLAQHNPNVTRALPNWRGSSACTWHIALQCGPFIYHNPVDDESLYVIDTTVLHRIRYRRFEKLLDWQGRLFASKP